MKLIAIEEMLRGKKLVVLEDSIVRGTQLKNQTLHKLFDADADEIHIRAACPPLMLPCRYGKSTKNRMELVTRRAILDIHGKDIDDERLREMGYFDPESKAYAQMINWIRDDLDAEVDVGPDRLTLMYQRLNDMVEAIGLPKEKLCTHCWEGDGV